VPPVRVKKRPRALTVALSATLAVAAALLAWPAVRRELERRVVRRARAEAARLGLQLQVERVEVSPSLRIRLERLTVERKQAGVGRFEWVEIEPRLWGRGLGRVSRVAIGPGRVALPHGFEVETRPSTWQVTTRRGQLQVAGFQGGLGVTAETSAANGGGTLVVQARGLRLQQMVEVRWNGTSLVEGGLWDGTLVLRRGGDGKRAAQVRMVAKGLRLAALPRLEGLADGSRLGEPVDVDLDIAAASSEARSRLQVATFRLVTDRVVAEGHGQVESSPTGSELDVQLRIDHLDLRGLFDVLGLDPPAGDLGSLSAAVAVSRRPDQPGPITVRQSLVFSPPRSSLAAVERLREPFTYRVVEADGNVREIEVRPGAPGFVALDEVPPLFVQTLLLAEDFGFHGHAGVDPSAMAEAAVASLGGDKPWRGASTITQQLAKNLLLSKERTLTRKLSEVPLALLLDSRLEKERQLEIYLNIVEWGPGLYGLRSAAEHYFGKTPARLRPKEMAFLVRLIPGPLIYQRSFASGELSPAFEELVLQLLGKLWSTGALTDAEYQEALLTRLEIRGSPRSPLEPAVDAEADRTSVETTGRPEAAAFSSRGAERRRWRASKL
jgi:hypothetical protein